MKTTLFSRKILCIFLLLTANLALGQKQNLEEFENTKGWDFIMSDGVTLNLNVEEGRTGKALRFDYDFTKGTGYGGVQKWFPIDLPENYEFTFWLKADSPSNNFEIKFIDSSGDNVWWVNNRNYDFPEDWRKIRIRKRHIGFAWGPTDDRDLKRIDRIEFTIASFVGGKGTIWLDDLTFEPLPPVVDVYPKPLISASSFQKGHHPDAMLDGSDQTQWISKGVKNQHVLIDFTTSREFGGLQINWLESHNAEVFDILLSNDKKNWEKAYSVAANRGKTSFIRLQEAQAKFVKLEFQKGASDKGFGINDISILDVRNSLTVNDFLIYAAKNSPKGYYPRYFLEQASYWNVSGVNNDVNEALINEDGMVEVKKAGFSIEPMLKIGDEFYNWSNVKATQSLGFDPETEEFTFLPSVHWNSKGLKFTTALMSSGEANKSSMLDIRYSFENTTQEPVEFELFLLIRPFQVNPYYQFLNLPGGAGKIHSIREEAGEIIVDDKVIMPQRRFDAFGAGTFDDGNPVEMLQKGYMPARRSASDQNRKAHGMLKYSFRLEPGGKSDFNMLVPYHNKQAVLDLLSQSSVEDEFLKKTEFWKTKTDHIQFNLPASAERIINTWKANLVYILINRDKAGIQPGSRSYERSWIRDGSLTSSALLKSGIVEEVRDFIEWYAPYQYESGKVPCVVDFRGPDPVPEHDSHGQLIYLIREYYNFTHDTAFLRSKNEHVLQAVNYIESLIAERSTDHYRYGNDSIRAHYGIVPESISHEGYSEKPMHSYWDNFFVMKGLKDAVDIQKILGLSDNYHRIKQIRDTFRVNFYNSIDLAMKYKGIEYIPGCVELGDFDPTSTTIALTPCNELQNLPRPQVYNTFNLYYEFFQNRRDNKISWVNYTPYENRQIGTYIILDQPERAHELIEYFLNDRRPQEWYHWAEIVWKDYRLPRFIGDMPHTWVGSDFINAIRSMFVYENEYDQTLVLASALYQDWIDAPDGMSVENLPTYYGDISYSIKNEGDFYRFKIYGDLQLPSNGMRIRNFNGSKKPVKVVVNGVAAENFCENEISVGVIPSEVLIYY